MATSGTDAYPADGEVEYKRTIAVKTHIATDESQLSLQVGDIVIVLEEDETGWWGGHKENDEFTGWFPGSCVKTYRGPSPSRSQRPTSQVDEVQSTDTAPVLIPEASSAAPCVCGDVSDRTRTNRRSALQTSISSPNRNSVAVASPQRPSMGGRLSACPGILQTPAQEDIAQGLSAVVSRQRASVVEAVAGQHSSDETVQLLKQKNQELLNEIHALRRQSDADRRPLEDQVVELEQRITAEKEEKEAARQEAAQRVRERETLQQQREAEQREREAEKRQTEAVRLQLEQHRSSQQQTMRELEQYKAELRSKDEEVAHLKRISMSGVPAQTQEPRRQLFEETRHPATSPSPSPVPVRASPSQQPVAVGSVNFHSASPPLPTSDRATVANAGIHRHPASCTSIIRSASTGGIRVAEEEPPRGIVQQLRSEYESRSQSRTRDVQDSRSSTPRRAASSTALRDPRGPRQQEAVRAPIGVPRPQTVSTAPELGSGAYRVGRSGAAPGRIATDRPSMFSPEEVDFGMSPIRKEKH